MEEYFEVFAESFGSFFLYFKPYALEIGLFLIVLEVVLGIAVLLWYRMYITSIILLVLMVFFTFLTFYSAYFDKVTDCGCFGDAIKLTPWESFSKDIFLMIFVLHLFWYRRKYYEVSTQDDRRHRYRRVHHHQLRAGHLCYTAPAVHRLPRLPGRQQHTAANAAAGTGHIRIYLPR